MKVLIQQVINFVICTILMMAAGFLLESDHFRYAIFKGKFRPSDELGVKQTVEHFNKLFSDVSASMGRTSSDALPATKSMRHKLYMDTGVNAMGKQVLIYDLASLEIQSVSWQEPLVALVKTKEAWNYQYKSAVDKSELDIIKGMDDEFRYLLVKRDGKWLVHSSTALLKDAKRDT